MAEQTQTVDNSETTKAPSSVDYDKDIPENPGDELLNDLVKRSLVKETGKPKIKVKQGKFAKFEDYCEFRARQEEFKAAGWREKAKQTSKFSNKADKKKASRAMRAFSQITTMIEELRESNADFDPASIGIDLQQLSEVLQPSKK